MLPPSIEEERQADEATINGTGEGNDTVRTGSPPQEPVEERRAASVGGCHKDGAETGEQAWKRINKERNEAHCKSSGRGQRSERCGK